MKPSLILKMGQQLSMTPQLQQAIKLLQLSTIELQQEIQTCLESNVMLELQDDEYEDIGSSTQTADDALLLPKGQEVTFQDNVTTSSACESDVIPEELPVDTNWDDVYQGSLASNGTSSDYDGFDDFTTYTAEGETLETKLLWQLNLTPMTHKDQVIAMHLIDSLNEEGFLEVSLEEILEGLDPGLDADIDEVKMVLHRIQQFEPSGIGARDLKECLLLQLNARYKADEWFEPAVQLVTNYLDVLATQDFNRLGKCMGLSEQALKEVVTLIRRLDPKPGLVVESEQREYIIPDIIVRKEQRRWIVELNQEVLPKLRVNTYYATCVQEAGKSVDNQFLKSQLQEARWFIKSLYNRNDTLIKVATKIVERQRAFLEYGDEAMKPLVLADIAREIEMHESTISRITQQKYMQTPRGVYELKYFFSSHLGTAGGGECSSIAIRAMIKKLVASEDPKKPLSDSKLMVALEQQGIQIARRTIAKYREELGIASSSDRKKMM